MRANPPLSEDCLVLNVYTPARPGGPRPVLVYIHGGVFDYSSGTTLFTDGTNLARSGDVTVVSVNHRLNVFGYLLLDEVGSTLARIGRRSSSTWWRRWNGCATTSPASAAIRDR